MDRGYKTYEERLMKLEEILRTLAIVVEMAKEDSGMERVVHVLEDAFYEIYSTKLKIERQYTLALSESKSRGE